MLSHLTTGAYHAGFSPALLVISSHDPETYKGASSLGVKGGSLHYAMSLRTKYTTFLSLSTTFYLLFVRPPIFSQATPFFRYPTCRVDAKRIPLPMGQTSGAVKPGQIIKMRRLVSIHSIASVPLYGKHFLDLCGERLSPELRTESVSYVYVPLQKPTAVFPAPYPWVSPPTCPLPPACLALRTRGPTAPPPAGRAVN